MGSRHAECGGFIPIQGMFLFFYLLPIVYIGASVQKMLCVFMDFMMSGIRNEFLSSMTSPSEFLHILYQSIDEFPR